MDPEYLFASTMTFTPCVYLFLSLVSLASGADPIADEIVSLPGWSDPFRSKRYGGFLQGSDSTRHISYYFVESESDPSSDPVILWVSLQYGSRRSRSIDRVYFTS